MERGLLKTLLGSLGLVLGLSALLFFFWPEGTERTGTPATTSAEAAFAGAASAELQAAIVKEIKAAQKDQFDRLAQALKDDQKANLEKLLIEVGQISRRLGVLERDIAARPLPGALVKGSTLETLRTELEQKLLALSQKVHQPRGFTFALLGLSLVQLKQAAATGASFKEELSNLTTLMPPSKTLTALRTYESGVRSRAWLERDYKRLAVHAGKEAHSTATIDSSVILSFLLKLVKIRPVGERSGSDAESLLSQIRARLNEGDFTSALALEEGLKTHSSAYAPLATWFALARRRQDLDQHLVHLDQALGKLLSAQSIKNKKRSR